MKKIILVISLLMASVMVMADGIAYVNTQKVLQNYKETENTQKFLESKKAELQEDLDIKKSELENKQKELSENDGKLDETEKQKLQEMQNEFQVQYQKMQQNLNVLQQTMYEKLRSDIDTAIKEVAKENKYDTVLDKAVVYYGGEDITQDVIEFLMGAKKIKLD